MNNLGLPEFIVMLVIIGIILSILMFLAWFFVSRAKAKDKQFLIEKGISPNDPSIRTTSQFTWLRFGIVVIGISLSLFLILFLSKYISMGAIHGYAIVLLITGLSMVAANYIGKSNE